MFRVDRAQIDIAVKEFIDLAATAQTVEGLKIAFKPVDPKQAEASILAALSAIYINGPATASDVYFVSGFGLGGDQTNTWPPQRGVNF